MGSAPMVLETAIIEPSEVSKRKGKDKQQTDSGEVGSPTILSQHGLHRDHFHVQCGDKLQCTVSLQGVARDPEGQMRG